VTLDQFASIGEIISSVGVVISLIYLAIQIRSNTDAERSATYRSIVSDFGAMNNAMAATPELSYLFTEGMENYHQFEPRDKARISQSFFQCFHYFENMYYQHKKGYMDDDVWLGWKRLMLTYYSAPGFQTWWQHRHDVYSKSFADFLASEEPDKKILSYYDLSHLQTEGPNDLREKS